ncbi:MAG: DUF4329 domain-containing protein [Gammaproteobacteria bacterium]|nr:DUF4329 domain-containing protein [Gammaproteobacteria bacterium]
MDLSYTHIKSAGLEDRTVYGLGFTGDALEVSFMQVNRNQENVGSAFSIASHYKKHRIGFDYLEQANEASFTRFAYQTHRQGKRYQVSLQAVENPLYESKTENRIVFSLGFDVGSKNRFYATEEESQDPDKQPEKQARKSSYLFGAIGVGLGVGMSSGSGGADGAARQASQHEAARSILNEINPTSVAINREHGGYIYRNADGSYASTTPIQGSVDSITLPHPVYITPAGTTTTASYHTHAGPDPRYDSENFSAQDLFSDIQFSLDGYLGTPGGQFKYHNYVTGSITTLGTISN